ncbi:MAG: hypothetical protein ACTSYA_00690 [Candidatus Kariarchaeaceae archaeon]
MVPAVDENEKYLEPYLFVGEKIRGIETTKSTEWIFLILSLILFFATGVSGFVAYEEQLPVLYGVIPLLFIYGVYFLLRSSVRITCAFTDFRLFKMEVSNFARIARFFSESLPFEDIHYEHIETIEVGTPSPNRGNFTLGVFVMSLAALLFTYSEDLDNKSKGLVQIFSIIIAGFGIFLVILALPRGKGRLSVLTSSGRTITFPGAGYRVDFVQAVIRFARTYLAYGLSVE